MREPRCTRVAVMSRFYPCCRDPVHHCATASYAAYDMEGEVPLSEYVFVHSCPNIDYKRAKTARSSQYIHPNRRVSPSQNDSEEEAFGNVTAITTGRLALDRRGTRPLIQTEVKTRLRDHKLSPALVGCRDHFATICDLLPGYGPRDLAHSSGILSDRDFGG